LVRAVVYVREGVMDSADPVERTTQRGDDYSAEAASRPTRRHLLGPFRRLFLEYDIVSSSADYRAESAKSAAWLVRMAERRRRSR
jgi:hypothetical protein